jgi:hypothetical protein
MSVIDRLPDPVMAELGKVMQKYLDVPPRHWTRDMAQEIITAVKVGCGVQFIQRIEIEAAKDIPLVKAVLDHFPGATVDAVYQATGITCDARCNSCGVKLTEENTQLYHGEKGSCDECEIPF